MEDCLTAKQATCTGIVDKKLLFLLLILLLLLIFGIAPFTETDQKRIINVKSRIKWRTDQRQKPV